MVRLPEKSLVIRREALTNLGLSHQETSALLAFDKPSGEAAHLLVYGPYFDFESLAEVSHRLDHLGLQYWDDYVDLKEDIPVWISLFVSDHSASSVT
ncbi:MULTISPECIES: hypothetical protein [unclassified Yoonia]|uniref:hypothetical protein n=1 Tax=unclassified Yoonia TaxID=2629118 RepID=UPI002AFFC95F|nr:MULTISPECIES: hypothetical protein [unclassified Yoonia]